MTQRFDPLEILDTMMQEAARRDVVRHTAMGPVTGRTFMLAGQELLHFGSCSYMGLEQDPRLVEGVIRAVRACGTQFSSSRAYVSAPLYTELEELLEQIFGGQVVATPSTSLGHQAALPVLVGATDAVIFDQQVHHSVQAVLPQLRLLGTHVELLRHNQLDLLEERLTVLAGRHRRVWYLADGVYSMYGNLAPIGRLSSMLARHEALHLYLDDAHGMSWAGPRGCGHVLGALPGHPRLVVATSLNKAFAAAGGAVITFDPEHHRRVRTLGGPMIFAGPIQPPMLGAAVASARLHLSSEFAALQEELAQRIAHCNRLLLEHELPVVHAAAAPIRFIGLGLPKVAFNMVARLRSEGYYTNPSTFPAVPMGRSGLRFTLTRHQRLEDIEGLVRAIAHHLPLALADEGSSREAVQRTFDLAPARSSAPGGREGWTLTCVPRVAELGDGVWDDLLLGAGGPSAALLATFEELFQGHERPEENWSFHYFLIRDPAGVPVLATCFTETLWKDDMLAPEAISRQVEAARERDPYFLTTRTLGMGTLLTSGGHLYLDRSRDWRSAMTWLIEQLRVLRATLGASTLVLRDFPAEDAEFTAFLLDEGFVRLPMPARSMLELQAADEAAWVASLGRRPLKHYRREIAPWNEAYALEVITAEPEPELAAHGHELYRAVKAASLALNPFELPVELFGTAMRHPGWELLVLRWRGDDTEPPAPRPVAVVLARRDGGQYMPVIVGMDYRFVRSRGLYRQCLRQVVRRAMALGLERIDFGVGSELEKRRFGAVAPPQCGYFETLDHEALDRLAQFSTAIAPPPEA